MSVPNLNVTLVHPTLGKGVNSQTYGEHYQRAKTNGWGYKSWEYGNVSAAVWYYPGWDIADPSMPPVVNSLAGTVKEVGDEGSSGYGVHVHMLSGDIEIIYAHLKRGSVLVKTGQLIPAGQQLAIMDNTGNSTGTHLHWEVRYKGIPIDGMPYVGTVQPQPPADWSTAKYAVVDVALLRARLTPEIIAGNIIKAVPNGTTFVFAALEGDWVKCYTYLWADYMKPK